MSVLGLDAGTSRVKAVRFDNTWHEADTAAETTPVHRGSDGRREQDMAKVWTAAVRVLGKVVANCPDRIDAVAVTAQGDGCWLVDATGEPAGPALLWNDSRTAGIVGGWQADGTLDAAFRISGCYGAPGLASAQLRWLSDRGDPVLDRARVLLSCGSWLYQQLTGRQVLDMSDAANPFLDAVTGTYSPQLLELFGLEPLAALLPPVVTGAERAAPIRPDIAATIGLPAGTPVVLGPYDVVATAIGSGAVQPAAALAILGTTLCVGSVVDDPHLSRPANGMTLPLDHPHTWLTAFATMTGTEVLDWTAALLGLPDAAAVAGLAATSMATDLPVLLPYLSSAGERSPFLDAGIRGSLHGLQLHHSRADVARAAVDGLSLVVRECAVALGELATLAVCGGGARSALWCQSISDATGIPVVRTRAREIGALGAALSAATDLGMFTDLPEAVSVVETGEVLTPDHVQAARLDGAFEQFCRLRAHP
jgi:xylulokinase/erythritol kinase